MSRPELELGRRAFGGDPGGYEAARLDYPARLFELVAAECGAGPGVRAFEIGPGTGKATRPMLGLGLDAVTGVEPDARLAAWLRDAIPDPRLSLAVAPFEAAELPDGAFGLGYAATSFHWLEAGPALAKVRRLLRPGGAWAMWWNIYMDPDRPDPFRDAVTPMMQALRAEAPSFRGDPPNALPRGLARALDTDGRVAELAAAGFGRIAHRRLCWEVVLDPAGIRALYGSFSVMRDVAPELAEAFLARAEEIARRDFGGRVTRACTTVLYTARKPG